MDENILNNDKSGEIKISNEVLSVISGMAVNDIEGVYSLVEDTSSNVYSKKLLTKGIMIDYKNSEVSVALNIIVKYGFNINDVAREVQLKIKDALENMIGFDVKAVNVVVSGVYTKDADK